MKAKHQLRTQTQPARTVSQKFDPKEGRCSKDFVADQQRLQISDPHFDKFSTPATSAFGRQDSRPRCVLVHNFLRRPCRGSKKCRGIISYTSYSRTNDCIYNGYDNINLEPNAMNNIDTVAHMNMHYTQY